LPESKQGGLISLRLPDVRGSRLTPQTVAGAFEAACLAELQAIKPGNVHIFADGHGMVVGDFIKSAHAAAGVIALPGLSVGQRILQATEATWQAVACNTNLGIVLLVAPLAHAALLEMPLPVVLAELTVDDAADCFRAIVRASPAGLGDSPRHDVRDAPQVTLLEAMREAAAYDRIAWQYASGFADVYEFGLPRYREAFERWGNEAWAVTAVHLGFMARFQDTHIVRKYGEDVAESLRQEAQQHETALLQCENPKKCLGELLRFDARLKRDRLNPGTSADLTVACIFVVSMEKTVR
jgi:triphosphoribosyl-dephospho-CoA synthase